jgi:hydroxymethylbilane synthase
MGVHFPLRIGTRGSPLALVQTAEIRRRLAAAFPELEAPGAMETTVIRTTGDAVQDRTLAEIGGKGLFTKEIDEALLDGSIDIAVNSMKDVPTWLPDGIVVGALPEREDTRDAFIGRNVKDLAALPAGSVLGTASLRRQAQILHLRPDLRVVPLRGNVDTRLTKLADGVVDATLLAIAGLKRLGKAAAASSLLSPDEMLPAVAQGAIGITCRSDQAATRDMLAALNHAETAARVAAERAFLEVLDGSCKTPIAALAEVEGDDLRFRGLIALPDGSSVLPVERRGAAADAAALGRDAGEDLRQRAGPRFLAAATGH